MADISESYLAILVQICYTFESLGLLLHAQRKRSLSML